MSRAPQHLALQAALRARRVIRGTFLLVVVPGAAVAIVGAVVALALASHASVLLYDRLIERWPGV